MPSPQTQPSSPVPPAPPRAQTVSAERLVFFSDAVIAIAITLLVLDIRVPRIDELTTGHLSLVEALLNQWPSYLSYVIGFIIIGEMWAVHHILFNYIKRADHGLITLNTFLLLCIAFIPFATALLAEYIERPERTVAAFVYGLALTASCFFFNGIWWYARRHPRLLDPALDAQSIKGITTFSTLLLAFYACATLLAWVSAVVSIGLYVLLATMMLVSKSDERPRDEAPRWQQESHPESPHDA